MGKPVALNLAFAQARGEICVLTDGDAEDNAKRNHQAKGQAPARMRSFGNEVREGIGPLLRYPRSWREWSWTALLLGARLHLWGRVWLETRVKHRPHREVWRRVESTK